MIKLIFKENCCFEATSRGHQLLVDVPQDKGGSDLGMMPTDIYAVSLGSCVGITTAMWLKKNNFSPRGLEICVEKIMDEEPRRISSLKLAVSIPEKLPDKSKQKLREVLQNCPLMLSVKQLPQIELTLRNGVEVA